MHQKVSLLGSYLLLVAGLFGMLFCFPFLWSSSLVVLVGAGLPFVAGAILVVGGLLSLTLQANRQGEKNE